jgi:metal-responsive CopG/Arc/MetJ family transcriptional regulator
MKKTKVMTEKFNMYFPKDLYEEFQNICKKNYTTFSSIIRQLVIQYVKENKNKQ